MAMAGNTAGVACSPSSGQAAPGTTATSGGPSDNRMIIPDVLHNSTTTSHQIDVVRPPTMHEVELAALYWRDVLGFQQLFSIDEEMQETWPWMEVIAKNHCRKVPARELQGRGIVVAAFEFFVVACVIAVAKITEEKQELPTAAKNYNRSEEHEQDVIMAGGHRALHQAHGRNVTSTTMTTNSDEMATKLCDEALCRRKADFLCWFYFTGENGFLSKTEAEILIQTLVGVAKKVKLRAAAKVTKQDRKSPATASSGAAGSGATSVVSSSARPGSRTKSLVNNLWMMFNLEDEDDHEVHVACVRSSSTELESSSRPELHVDEEKSAGVLSHQKKIKCSVSPLQFAEWAWRNQEARRMFLESPVEFAKTHS
ncbi:unnamed protein product [Amoebophrya sp. A120]|nr:unnamed protein product [Amoebophrya sp. A120]|eukprot:GSA120T00016197001.1